MKEAVLLFARDHTFTKLNCELNKNKIAVKQISKLPTVTVQPGPNTISQAIPRLVLFKKKLVPTRKHGTKSI